MAAVGLGQGDGRFVDPVEFLRFLRTGLSAAGLAAEFGQAYRPLLRLDRPLLGPLLRLLTGRLQFLSPGRSTGSTGRLKLHRAASFSGRGGERLHALALPRQ
jgi:hypothetical protein